MKKILFPIFALSMAVFSFTSCEDVPAPYDIPTSGGSNGGQELPEGVYLDQSFATSLGDFESVGNNDNISWIIDYSSACITGYKDYGSGSKSNQAGVTYLVSPEIDLTNSQEAYVEMSHALNYERGDINTNNALLISKDYAGDPTTCTWTPLKYDTEGLNSSFDFVDVAVNIPAEYIGQKVRLALRHTCSDAQSSTWEVKTLALKEGKVEGNDDNNQELPEGYYLNQNFSSSLGDFASIGNNKNIFWINDYSSACITGYKDYGSGTKSNQAGVTYLVSPEVDLTASKEAFVKISQALNYERGDINTNNALLISKDYAGDPTTCTWTPIIYKTDGLNSSFTFADDSMNIPAEFIGQKVRLALRHTCSEASSSTWEVKSLAIKEGKVAENSGNTDLPTGYYLNQNFASNLGDFASIGNNKNIFWYNDYSSACITGYKDYDGDGVKSNEAGVTYLVSPEVNLTASKEAFVEMNHALNYERGDINANNALLISTDYAGDPTTCTWTPLVYKTDGLGSSFSFVNVSVDIPATFVGKKVRIAMRHTCSDEQSSTWEVKNLAVREGKAGASTGDEETGKGETIEGNTLTVNFAYMGYDNQQTMTTVTLSDGTTMTFDGGGNNSIPKYYNSGTAVRMYPKNSVTFTGSKPIKSIALNCNVTGETIYNASGDISADKGTVATSDEVVSITDINASSTKITNVSTTTGAPSQLRIMSIKITYAE